MVNEVSISTYERYAGGKDWTVYVDPTDENLLIKEAKGRSLSEKRMNQLFHLGKLLHILFPNNIPDVCSTSVENGSKLKVQRIMLDDESETIRDLYQNKSVTKLTDADLHFFNRIKAHPNFNALRTILLELGLHIEVVPENFGFDMHNNLYYLDSDLIDPYEANIDARQLIGNLRAFIQKFNLGQEREQALLHLKELEDLLL